MNEWGDRPGLGGGKTVPEDRQASSSKPTHSEVTAFNSLVSCHSVQPETVQKVRVSPYESATDTQVTLHYFFHFSFVSFLFFTSLFFFNFLFCLGSCLASNFLFLSLEKKKQ